MKEITLYEFESPNISVLMKVCFNEENKLIFRGHDIGKIVGDLMGSSDYEYLYSVKFNEVEKIANILGVDINKKTAFLKEIKNRFNENDAYSKFGAFMKEKNIVFESFVY